MKATLLLGAILLMSLVMANDQDKSSPESKSSPEDKSLPENKEAELGTKQNTTAKGSGIKVSEGPVFFLLPLVWMMVQFLYM